MGSSLLQGKSHNAFFYSIMQPTINCAKWLHTTFNGIYNGYLIRGFKLDAIVFRKISLLINLERKWTQHKSPGSYRNSLHLFHIRYHSNNLQLKNLHHSRLLNRLPSIEVIKHQHQLSGLHTEALNSTDNLATNQVGIIH